MSPLDLVSGVRSVCGLTPTCAGRRDETWGTLMNGAGQRSDSSKFPMSERIGEAHHGGMEILAGDGGAVRTVHLVSVTNSSVMLPVKRNRLGRHVLATLVVSALMLAIAAALTGVLRSPVEVAPGSRAASPALTIR